MTVSKVQKPKQLGQHIFNGSDDRWHSAVIDPNGRAYLHDYPTDYLIYDDSGWRNSYGKGRWMLIGDGFDSKGWRDSAIDRAVVDNAKAGSERTVVVQFHADAQRQIEDQHKEILALKSLVNVQDTQLKEFESKEDMYSEVLSETLQTLYAIDPEARVSLTAGQLLQLTEQPNEDDLPFF